MSKLYEFKRTTNAFNFVFEKELGVGDEIIVKMPTVSANKRGINDIGWMCNGDVTLYGTIAKDPAKETDLWQEIRDNDEINKVTSAIKIINNGGACKIAIRAIFN